jgi:hypothetical protein
LRSRYWLERDRRSTEPQETVWADRDPRSHGAECLDRVFRTIDARLPFPRLSLVAVKQC